MKAIFVLLLAFSAAFVASSSSSSQFFTEQELEAHFGKFKQEYRRIYRSRSEESARKQIFTDNLEFILRSNLEAQQGRRTYLVAVNNFTDLSNGEYRRTFNGYRPPSAINQRRLLTGSSARLHFWNEVKGLPAQVDWVQEGVVTPVKNQGQCGSCWAFSTVASIEGQHALHNGGLVSLSEQNLVDCSGAQGNQGCSGGWMDNAFEYVKENGGIDTEASYPYTAEQGDCSYNTNSIGATVSGFVDVVSGDEGALQNAVASIGPISVAIDASAQSFQFYSSGVYNEPGCSPVSLDHGVTAVGYGTLNGVDYWKVKNSWGPGWGDGGYIMMSRNRENQCGIATKASYPTV